MRLTPTMERYVLHWGEMGQRWGVNRSVAQIHALLYLSSAVIGRPARNSRPWIWATERLTPQRAPISPQCRT